MQKMKISKIRNVKTPTRGTGKSAGIDFYIPRDYPTTQIILEPGQRILILSGIKANIPEGYVLMAADKSGIAYNMGLTYIGGVIDEDYQGEIGMLLLNTTDCDVIIETENFVENKGIIQYILLPVNYAEVEEVPEDELYNGATERGEGGYGSTSK